MTKWTPLLILVLILIAGVIVWRGRATAPTAPPTPTATLTAIPTAAATLMPAALPVASPTSTPTVQSGLVPPIADFRARITKKFFGTYITPATSPVQPERFTGYHTGVDVEYGDVTTDVPVHAISDGVVVLARRATGYGGLVVIRHSINGKSILAVYGHLRPSSLPQVGAHVASGQIFAVLGTAYSSETDGERRHLHFGLLKGSNIDIRGYVQTKAELSGWYDPLTFYP